jgi:hypothetical protein
MYTSIAPTATMPITKITVDKTTMTTLLSLSWLGHKLMPEVLAFRAKALFDCANILGDDGTPLPAALVRRGIRRLLCGAGRQRAKARLFLLRG